MIKIMLMSSSIALKTILVFDIETVSTHARYKDLSERMQRLWSKKANQISRNILNELSQEEIAQVYYDKAGIYAEFAKIVCISVGVFVIENGEIESIRTKSFYGHDEAKIINSFFDLVSMHFNNPLVHTFAGHNIREFDMPFICRRATVHSIELPKMLDIQGKRPWQIDYVYDTLDMWRFGDFKNYTSLDLIAALFDIPTPKDDIDGSMVGKIYWEEDDLVRIYSYCEKDIVTSCKVLMHLLQIDYDIEVLIISSTPKDEEE